MKISKVNTTSAPGSRSIRSLDASTSLESGALTPQVFEDTMRQREQLQKRYGVLLIEHGILSPAEIYRFVRQQIERFCSGGRGLLHRLTTFLH